MLWLLLGLPRGSVVKNASQCGCGRCGFDPWVGKIPGGGNDNPLQYSCLGNPTDRGAWWATVYGATKSWTRLSNWTYRHTHTCCVAREILLLQMGWSVECYRSSSRRVSSWLRRCEKWFNKELCPVSVRKLHAPSSICSFVGVNQ